MDKTNIVSILADDLGMWGIGCYGNREIDTPSIDRLAARGVRFDNYFCASPVCSPARASLLTGRIPSQHGVHDWLADGNFGENAFEYLEGMRGYTEVLAENGYTCGLSGKWHLGDSFNPQKRFSFWYAHARGGGPYFGAPMIREGEMYEESDYVTDAITREALSFIDTQHSAGSPFYLSVHYTAPHSPWIDNHPTDIVDYYDDCPFESCPDEPYHPWFVSGLRDMLDELEKELGHARARREILKGYFAAVTAMDSGIGRILERLEELGIIDNTLVVFSSDNGMNMGHHGFYGKGNGTYPQNMYENSVKVPMIVSHPGWVPEHSVFDALVSAYDFAPTLLDYLGLSNPDAGDLPGSSFAGELLSDRRTKSDAEESGSEQVVVFDEYGPVRMIRNERYKLVRRYYYGPDELYDLREDPDERRNLIRDAGYTDVRSELEHRLDTWFDRWVDPELDGIRERVSGAGQVSPVRRAHRAPRPFKPKDLSGGSV